MKRLHTSVLVALAAAIPCLTLAQAPSIEWQNTVGGNKTDMLYSLQQTGSSNYIVGGISNSGPTGDKSEGNMGGFDFWVAKLDQSGNVLWENTIGGSKIDYLNCVQQTSDGGYILGGVSQSNASGDKTEKSKGHYDYWVVKIDATGAVTWDKTIGGSKDDYLKVVRQTSDGGYILAGYSESNISGDKTESSRGHYDYWVVKLNSNGALVWDKTIGGSLNDWLYSILQTSDGGFLLGGTSGSKVSGEKSEKNKGRTDYWLVKIDANGNLVWDKTIGGSTSDYLYSIKKTDGGYILGGYSDSNISGDKTENSKGTYDYWVVKVDMDTNVLWDKTIGGNDEDECFSIGTTTDGGFILGGYSESGISGDKSESSKGYYDYWVVKLDQNGSVQWDKTIGGNDVDELYDIQQVNDGGYILGGYSNSNISGDKTENNVGTTDWWVVKLGSGFADRGIPVSPSSSKDEDNFDALIYPNPSAGVFSIVIHEPLQQEAIITVLNTLGETVYLREFTADVFESAQTISLGKEISSGMYFLKIASGDKVITRQIVVKH